MNAVPMRGEVVEREVVDLAGTSLRELHAVCCTALAPTRTGPPGEWSIPTGGTLWPSGSTRRST